MVGQGLFVGVGRVLINRVRLHSPTDVRFAPKNGVKADVPGSPRRANRVILQCRKTASLFAPAPMRDFTDLPRET